ncbi:hypothetical protein DUNSADRAFT_5577 [Dunaliella salina]|uniref:Encoded protein n=1 Tax=Dunaliella salina TaxID=3046 RepID=A0ABQ7GQ14_DUNSA|nr:hypothetical protein DUNSADRAFT_5577 [Dunaliella salina]|eukprot:KAF5836702.1 hypothetical protein DUNSADRAFT_5577 [Dunaliella salina]
MTHTQHPPRDPRYMAFTNFTTKDRHYPETGRNGGASSSRANTGPKPRLWQSEQTSPVEGPLDPPCLDKRGRWAQEALPHMTVVPSQAQHLTAVGADVPAGSLGSTGLGGTHRTVDLQGHKAVGGIHSYADVSPLVATECVHDTEGWADKTSEAWHATTLSMTGDAARAGLSQTLGGSIRRTQPREEASSTTRGVPAVREARNASVDNFWSRSGSGMSLRTSDLARSEMEPSGQVEGPYSNNARLIGGKWRYMERPKTGQPLYTDYYGPVCGGAMSNYYGRSYHYAPQ